MDTPVTEINQETDLIGTVTSNISATSTQFTATFIDKKTGQPRVPQTNTLEYTIDQDNPSSETILASLVSTDVNGVTTITIATNGRAIPKFGTGPGSSTGLSHVIGAAVGCVDIARPLNLLAEIAGQKANLDGPNFTGPVTILDGAGQYLRIPKLTTAQRLALPLVNGTEVYDTDIGNWYKVEGGAWSTFGSGSVPNAAPTVAGKVETGTVAQQIAHTSVGASGALLVPQIGNMITVSAGAGSAGKIGVLNANGKYDPSLLDAVPDSLFTTKGDMVVATGANTPVRFPVGSNDQVIVADSAQADGIKWGAVPLVSGNFDSKLYTRANDAVSASVSYNHSLNKIPARIRISATMFHAEGIATSQGTWNSGAGNNCVYNLSDSGDLYNESGSATKITNVVAPNNARSDVTTQVATITAATTTTFTLAWVQTGANPVTKIIDFLVELEA